MTLVITCKQFKSYLSTFFGATQLSPVLDFEKKLLQIDRTVYKKHFIF